MKGSRVILKKGKESIFYHRHQWIFSGAIASYPEPFEEGEIYPVYSYNKELLGHGYFRSYGSLSGRIISFGSKDPWQTVYDHLDHAISMRLMLFDDRATNAYRLVNGEGDHLPGLIIDRYSDYLVLQSSTLGIDKMKDKIVDYLIQKKRWKGIFEKSTSSSRKEEKLGECVQVLWGEDPEEMIIKENGLLFQVNWKKGQKTGFFLDQKEMRHLVKTLSKDRKVLNAFCYSGGFSIYALAGGAASVDSIDVSSYALSLGEANLTLNQLDAKKNRFIEADVFDYLRENSLEYDLVILDPPAFVKKKKDLPQGIKGYREINSQALKKMPKGSLLLTCSCSYYIDESLFRSILFQAALSAKRDIQIIKESLHSLDHPISLFHPEGRYLKSSLLFIS